VFKFCTKFEQNRIIRGRVIDNLAHFRRPILGSGALSLPVVNMSVKFDANVFIGDQYTAFYDFADLPIRAHSKCSQILTRPLKGTSLAGNTRFGV